MKIHHALIAVLLSGPQLLAQGPITPPAGPPLAGMKTLEQIEPRRPIPAAGPFPFAITQSGSYYLTGNVSGSVDAISVDAADVMIDLNGFTITASSGTPRAISVTANARRLTVSNGTILGGGTAIGAGSPVNLAMLHAEKLRVIDCTGIAIQAPSHSQLSNCAVRAVAATTYGIYAGSNSSLVNCEVNGGGAYGMVAADQSRVTDCSVQGSVTTGIAVGQGSIVERCSVTGMAGGGSSTVAFSTGTGCDLSHCVATLNAVNTAFDIGLYSNVRDSVALTNSGTLNLSYGFDLGVGSTATGCVASDMRSSYSPAGEFTGAGFRANRGVLIKDCCANENRGAGIIGGSSDGAIILNNICRNNGKSGTGSGIFLSGGSTENRIEGNLLVSNDTGLTIVSTALRNVVVRNTVGQNTTLNWDIPAGNHVAPVVVAVATPAFTGNTGGGSLGSTDPNANFTIP